MIVNRRRILVASTALFIVCGTLLSMYVAEVRAVDHANERAEAVLMSSAEEQAKTLVAVLDGRFRVLRSISASLSIGGETRPAAVEAELNDILEAADLSFSEIRLIWEDGAPVTEDTSYDINVADRDYFQKSMAGQQAMERIISRKDGKACFILSVPYYQGDRIRGVLRGLYNEEDMRALLTSQAYSGEGYSFLVSSRGDILVNAESKSKLLDSDNLFDALGTGSFQKGDSLEEMRSRFQNGQSGAIYYEYDGKSRVAVLVPLEGDELPENDWFVYSIIQEERLAEEIAVSRRDSMESLSIFAVFSILALTLLVLMEAGYRRRERRESELIRQREEQFRIVTEQSEKFVMRYDIPTKTIYRSDPAEDGFGGEPSCENPTEAVIEKGGVDPVSQADYREFFGRIDAGESPVTVDVLMVKPDGTRRWFKHVSTTIFDNSGEPLTAVISYYDNTEQRERELAYAKWQQELDSLPGERTALYEWNLTRDIFEGQRGKLALAYSGLPANSFDARAAFFAKHHVKEEDQHAFLALMNRDHLVAAYFSRHYRSSLEYRFAAEDGSVFWREITAQLVSYPDKQEIKAYITDRDIDAEKKKSLALVARTQLDYLTGALNRETFIGRVDELLRSSPASVHALFMLDVDGFKKINDTLGHDAGDKVLKTLTESMREVLRGGDIVGRIGGDEFTICLPAIIGEAAIEKKAEQLCTSLRRQINPMFTVSVSIGIAVYPRHGSNFNELYLCADAALYHAKRNGKDGYVFYEEQMSERLELTEIESEL